MRAVLDACVLFPPVLRDILLGMAEAGLYEPKWSERILEEWARATVKLGPGAEAQARGTATLMREVFPRAMQAAAPSGDIRTVLQQAAAAAAAGAETTKDFRAKFGRARNLGDRVIGHADPGAVSASLILKGCSEAL